MLKINIITLFPEMFQLLGHSIIGRAQEKEVIDVSLIDLRDFAINKYGQVDSTPYGGEAGMVLRPEPIVDAIKASHTEPGIVIYMTPQGKVFDQAMAKEFATAENITIICGHYKGIDERVCDKYVTHEVSIGDYVLTGGELGAMVVVDATTRMITGALGNQDSATSDSFYENRLAWPVYTRPREFEDMKVPDVLLSGDHKKIKIWQKEQSLKRTQERRPDLLK
ncbi:MAG: tRNA (guanosine(37)-N1)-methyltransferase TrmD [Fibrobacterales bacterium]